MPKPDSMTPAQTFDLFARPNYTGENWAASTLRPGCQDFLKHGSRNGDTVTPYKPPICNSTSKK
jgi:hypothetical protein